MSGFSFGSSSGSSSSLSTPAFSLSNSPSSGLSFGSSAPRFGSATATSSSPFGFGSSTSTSSSSSAPSFSFPFNSASTPASSLFGAAPSSSSATSASPLFGTISSTSVSSLFGSANSGFSLFGTASSATTSVSAAAGSGPSLFGTTSSSAPKSSSLLFGTTSPSAAPTSGSPLFGTTPSSAAPTSGSPLFGTTSSSAAPTSGDGGDEGEVVKKPMCPNSVEEAKNDSAAAASKAFGAVDEEESAETSPLSSLCVEVDRHVPSPHNVPIIKRILQKHGDITNGSILRSLEAKLAFLDLIGDVVNRLCTHTLETLCSHELQLMETNVADAVAVGFKVEWLQQRVDEIKTAKYQACSKELDELDKQIEAAKTSLMEMELRRDDLARDVAAIKKAKIEGNGFLGCTLSEGLL